MAELVFEVRMVKRSYDTWSRMWVARLVSGLEVPEDLKQRTGISAAEAAANLSWAIKNKLGVKHSFVTRELPPFRSPPGGTSGTTRL